MRCSAPWPFGRRGSRHAEARAATAPASTVRRSEVAAYVPAQVGGTIAGAVPADAMFAEPLVRFSGHDRSAGHLWPGEVVATGGLILLVLGLERVGRAALAPAAVAACIGAAYWFTSPTSFANPAVTVGRAFTDTFAGIAPGSVVPFVGAQLLGAVVGLAAVTAVCGSPAATPEAAVPYSDPCSDPDPDPEPVPS